MTFSPSTLAVFSELLNGYSLPANHPEFERVAAAISLAKRELAVANEQVIPEGTAAPAPQPTGAPTK